ncbi:Panacea domain-containing protein [Micropruina sp.]|uniref:Panacea domain-containing protein n=1 Tax=Micropruina sp. TaxID=2737536 RepID=UPI0039E30F8A
MTTAYDVLKYIKAHHRLFGETQAHKLLYYAQAWTLAWDGAPLFDDEIEAWQNGPVVRSIRYANPAADPNVPLTDQQKQNIAAVIEHYGKKSGAELGVLTHTESPWLTVWGDRPRDDACSDPIPHDLMRREYTLQSLRGQGPHRRAVESPAAVTGDILSRASVASRRWRKTLALLAE